jgi:rod shape determining protein RodA
MFKKYKLRNYDFLLVLAVVILTVIGILVVGSAKEDLQSKQIYGAIAGFVLMIIISFIDYTFVLKFYWILYAINIGLLIAVKLPGIGREVYGAQRWINIGGFGFQPSELAKILLILFFAQFIMKYIDKFSTFMMIGMTILFLAVPLGLIYSQPDMSTSIVVILIFCIILFTAGINWKIVLTVISVAVLSVSLFLILVLQEGQTIIEDYQRNRIMGFLYPEDYIRYSYQQLNSVIAIGSGQLQGKGLNNNAITSVKNGDFISQAQTDFIFSIVGEELGFIGCLAVILLVLFIIVKCLLTARKAKDLAGVLIASGIAALFGFQSFINMGVATFLLPNTGIPLPFVSYGLTSLLCSFMAIGFILNIRLQSIKKK